jgi:uncharacterized protein YjbI with pentapeptide repeats
MVARVRSWWQHIKQHWVAIEVVGIVSVVIIAIIIIGYQFDWTGFNGNNKSGKTLWDWMQLLFIPVVLAIAGFWFNHRERKATELRAENEQKAAEKRAEVERDIALDNQREAALQGYIDKISELLLDKVNPLRESKAGDEVRTIARVRTLTVLRGLDSSRKASVIQFLSESGLIDKDSCIISLRGADLSYADLEGATLNEVDLSHAILSFTTLSFANLDGATLNGAILYKADLQYAILSFANLSHAHLRETDLSHASLLSANLYGTDLSGARLSGAYLEGADLRFVHLEGADLSNAILSDTNDIIIEKLEKQTKSLKGATMPDGSIHP